MKSSTIGAVALFVTLLVAPGIAAQDTETGTESPRRLAPQSFGPNVLVTLVIGDLDDAKQPRTYRLVARDRGPRAELLIGWRMPIPLAQSGQQGSTEAKTEYTYQNVGVTARLRVEVLDDGRVLVEGEIEASGSRDKQPEEQTGGAPPTIGTFQQALSVLMRPNEPLRVAEVPDPEGGRLYLQLQVDVQTDQ